MNRIIVNTDGIYVDNVKIKKNVINISDNSEYFLEYMDSGSYEITFMVNGHAKLIESSFDKEILINNKYIIQNGCLEVTKFYNNNMVSETINIDLCEENAKIDYHFCNICRGVEDYLININHKCKKTISNVVNRSLALKNSHVKFIINSNVLTASIKSILNQNTRIVTLGDADALICPNMYIPLDDVNARHGSIIGTFKDDDIFYLMSKGISYNDTLKLLIKGYLFSNLKVNSDLRMKIMNVIDTYWR